MSFGEGNLRVKCEQYKRQVGGLQANLSKVCAERNRLEGENRTLVERVESLVSTNECLRSNIDQLLAESEKDEQCIEELGKLVRDMRDALGGVCAVSECKECELLGDGMPCELGKFESLRMELADFGDEVIRQGHQAGLEMPNMVTRHALRILEIMGR